MKRVVLFAVCAIAATAAAAQWHYLSGGKLSGISSVGSYVWTVGQDGLFFCSEDNGQHWRRVPKYYRNVGCAIWFKVSGIHKARPEVLRTLRLANDTTSIPRLRTTQSLIMVVRARKRDLD